jgi:Phage integrase family
MSAPRVKNLKLYRGDEYRPRWEPSPRLRRHGYRGRALQDDAGAWLPIEAAVALARALNDEAERGIAEGRRAPRRRGVERHPRSVAALWQAFKDSPRWQQLAASTRRDYDSKAALFLAAFGDEPAAALEPPHLYGWWEELHASHGHAMANGTLAVARLALSYAVRKGWRKSNPARQLGLTGVAPRVVFWLPAELEALVADADANGVPEVGDAVILAVHTAQRLGDVLQLAEDRIENGRLRLRQMKTNARISMPITQQLEARLAAIRTRRARGAVVSLETAASPRLVLDANGQPLDNSGFGKAFRAVRERVAVKFPECADKQFRDLRDTALTRLALAGCTVPEISAISGHSFQSVHQVLEHYLARTDAMADRAIERLATYLAENRYSV